MCRAAARNARAPGARRVMHLLYCIIVKREKKKLKRLNEKKKQEKNYLKEEIADMLEEDVSTIENIMSELQE